MSKSFRSRWLVLFLMASFVALLVAVGTQWVSSSHLEKEYQLGLAAFRKGDMAELSIAIEKVGQEPEFQSHWHLLRGLLLMKQNMNREALQELAEAIGDEETTALALSYSGEILHFAKDYPGAERMLLAAIQADPTFVEPHRILSAGYYDIGAMDNALVHLAKVIELAPQDMRPWRLRGLILKDFEKYDEAVRSYEGALGRTQEAYIQQEIREELAECLVRLRRYEDAMVQLKMIKPTAESKSLEADCLLALGKQEEAEQALQDALRLDPSHLRALTIRSTLFLEQGELEEAKDHLERTIVVHPFDFNLRSMLMQLLQRLGDKQGASKQEEKMKELRELKDRFAKLHIQSIENPNDASLRFELGNTAMKLGMRESAIDWYQATLGMDPTHLGARQQLSQLMTQPGPRVSIP